MHGQSNIMIRCREKGVVYQVTKYELSEQCSATKPTRSYNEGTRTRIQLLQVHVSAGAIGGICRNRRTGGGGGGSDPSALMLEVSITQ